MKIQCKDGVLDTGVNEFNSYNAERIHLQFVSVGREGIRAGKPQYQTPITVENARAVLEAQVKKAQRRAIIENYERTTWLLSRTDADLLNMQQRAFAAEMTLPVDVDAEMRTRGLIAKLHVDTGDFAQYVEAKNKAAREGRLSDFEDGIN